MIRSWTRRSEDGARTAVAANEDVVPVSQLREAYAKIRELERALGRKTMENEILRAAQEVVKKIRRCAKGPRGDGAADDGDSPRSSASPGARRTTPHAVGPTAASSGAPMPRCCSRSTP